MFRLPVLTSPWPTKSCCWLSLDRKLFARPIREFAEANRTSSLFVFWYLVFVLATFLHIVAVAGLDPIGAVDLLSHGTLLCHRVNDTSVIGGESWPLENVSSRLAYTQ